MVFKVKKTYKVFLEGGNLLMELREVGRFGYFATRYVQGPDFDSAANRALELVRTELVSSGAILNDEGDPPTAKITGIERIGFLEGRNSPAKGFTFFPEDK